MDILILNTISKFSKTKNFTQKDPLKFQNCKKMCREASNQKVYENRPPKSGHSDYNYNFKIFKNQKINSKKTPSSLNKNKKMYKEASNKKV